MGFHNETVKCLKCDKMIQIYESTKNEGLCDDCQLEAIKEAHQKLMNERLEKENG